MNELSRLLTFMFKEDRSEIIRQYNDMLDNAEDEEEMLKSFGSPTKLAVTISRSYNRDEMKLSTQADSKDGTSTDTIKLKPVIPEAQPQAAQPVKQSMTADDAYIDIIEEIRREKAAEEGIEYTPLFVREEPAPEPEAVEPEAAEEVPEEAPEVVEEAPVEDAPAEEDAPEAEETEQVEEEAPAEEAPVEEAPAEETEPEAAPEAEAEAPVEEVPEAEEPAPEPEEKEEKNLTDPAIIFAALEDEPEPAPAVQTETKTKVGCLILYLLLAIPLGLAAAVIMLGVELCILGAGIVVMKAGFELLSFTFSGMQVFADIIMCLGVTLGVFAVGILLLWLAVWLLIVSIPALVRGLKSLGRKLCVKEVEIDG